MNKSHGFTLLELMVVLAIVAILTTLAAPSFKRLIQSNTISGNVNTFLADMRYARSEAIRRGGGVVMCRSDNPETTTTSGPTCGSGSTHGWESGWIIFQDSNNSGTRTSGEPLLRVQAPITSIDSITEPGAATKFSFTATGRLLNLASAGTTLQFGGNGNYANDVQRIVCVSLGGRARIAGNGTASCP